MVNLQALVLNYRTCIVSCDWQTKIQAGRKALSATPKRL